MLSEEHPNNIPEALKTNSSFEHFKIFKKILGFIIFFGQGHLILIKKNNIFGGLFVFGLKWIIENERKPKGYQLKHIEW